MLYEIFKFEIRYRVKRIDTYLYFAILFFYSLIAVDFIFDGPFDQLKRNAPYIIARTMAIVTALFTMVTSMIMGVAALRDFDHQMESLMFINPIKKRDYLMGRFLGSFTVLIFIFSALLFGMMLGNYLPWVESSTRLPFNFWHFLHPFLFLVIPTLFFSGAIFFVSGALSKKLLVVYTQGIILVIAYILVMNLARGTDNLTLATLIDPFAFLSGSIIAQFWTVAERNSLLLAMEGLLLYNRVLWIAVGAVVLIIGHYAFRFQVVKGKKKHTTTVQESIEDTVQDHNAIQLPSFTLQSNFSSVLFQVGYHAWFHFKSMIKEVPFWAIVICGMAIIFANSINLGTVHGVESYPATQIIVEELLELSILFFFIIVVFYSGQIVWKERDAKLDAIYDSSPVAEAVNLVGKLLSLILTYAVLLSSLIVAGVLFQSLSGYYNYNLQVYFIDFFIGILPFLAMFTAVSFFFQVVTNQKYIGHIAVVAFLFLSVILPPKAFEIDHVLLLFGGSALETYSDMNGYGHFITPFLWIKTYWMAFSTILFLIAILFAVRGKDIQFKNRWVQSKIRFNKSFLSFSILTLLIFSLSGCYIFYNTNIVNHYALPSTKKAFRVNYEKTLKQFEHLPQPQIVDVKLNVELYPIDRDYTIEGYFILTNPHDEAISEIHIQKIPDMQVSLTDVEFEGGATVSLDYEEFSYYRYQLSQALQPKDSIKMKFRQMVNIEGFPNGQANTTLVENGTFINNSHFPTIGYNRVFELREAEDRAEHDLNPRIRTAAIHNQQARKEGRSGFDGEEINLELIIGTDQDQIAIASGNLKKEWTEENRKYYHYKSDGPISNFYSIVSARYEVMREKWVPAHDSLGKPVDLEIYYHKGHEYNLHRMMRGMRKSLDYFSKNFSPYQYQQMRILEIPSYHNKAQSFPNTVPFSESLGFILDINDEEDLDMAFFVTAHEVAHQWWGHQVNPANVQGKSMISETLAQYSALMVMKDEFPADIINHLIYQDRSDYLKARTREKVREMPLALVESKQKYIRYDKGLVNMHTLQYFISADSVNIALQRFIKDWNSFDGQLQVDRYPTTNELLGYFRAVTPDSLHYLITDLFENITFYQQKVTEASSVVKEDGTHHLQVKLEFKKQQIDSLGKELNITPNDFIELGIYDDKDELISLQKHRVTQEQIQLDIPLNQKPHKVVIDPNLLLMDRDLKDNELEVN